jgi:parvulin-like peptidyl-prolyl isomerase
MMLFISGSGIADPGKLSVSPDMIVATVNGRPITGRLLEVEARLPITLLRIKQDNISFYETLLGSDQGYDLLLTYKERILDQIIRAYVLFDLAETKGVGVSEQEVQSFVRNYLDEVLDATGVTLKEFENYMMLQGYESLDDYKMYLAFQRRLALTNIRLMESLIQEPEVSQAEIHEYLAHDSDQIVGVHSAHIYHILVETHIDAFQVMDALNEMSFEEAAKIYSQDELTKGSGGDLGWMEQGVFRQFDVIFSYPAGTVVGPIQTPLGYHILKAKALRGGESSQQNVEREIREAIVLEKRFMLWQQWLQNEFDYYIDIASIEILF